MVLCGSRHSSFLAQAFAFHYSMQQWLDFDKPLTRVQTPEFVNPEAKRDIEPSPTHRGHLNAARTGFVAQDLDLLVASTCPASDRLLAFIRLTGIHAPEHHFNKPCKLTLNYTNYLGGGLTL